MSLRTRAWGQVGRQAKRGQEAGFKVMPPLTPPDAVGLVPSEQAWGIPGAGVLIADELPPTVLPTSQRVQAKALSLLAKAVPNNQKLRRWSEETATRRLTEFLGRGSAPPTLWHDWRTDAGWARTFVQGPNAGDLRREGDVWVVDAGVLALGERRPGIVPLGVKIALEIDAQGARPAWIQMEDGSRVKPGEALWSFARIVASAAMQNYIGTVRHVINLHFVAAQGIGVLVHNHLPWHHPVARLMFPHSAGSLAVNWVANETFMGEGLLAEQTYAYTWKGIQQLVPVAFKAFSWDDYDIPAAFQRRGTMELIEKQQYPYGEDALLVWGVIQQYVRDYLSQYYPNDASVVEDAALQRGLESLDPCLAKPVRAKTFDELSLVLTRFIHMVSVEHKLVSGIAYDYFTNPYYFPTLAREGKTAEEAVPYREEAENNVMFRYAISAMAWPLTADWSYAALDPKGADAMRRFRRELLKAGEEIDRRNQRRSVPFPHLHPNGLDTSVAV